MDPEMAPKTPRPSKGPLRIPGGPPGRAFEPPPPWGVPWRLLGSLGGAVCASWETLGVHVGARGGRWGVPWGHWVAFGSLWGSFWD